MYTKMNGVFNIKKTNNVSTGHECPCFQLKQGGLGLKCLMPLSTTFQLWQSVYKSGGIYRPVINY